MFVCFVALRPCQQLWTVSSPNHTFFLGKLEQAVNSEYLVCTYFRLQMTTTLLEFISGRICVDRPPMDPGTMDII